VGIRDDRLKARRKGAAILAARKAPWFYLLCGATIAVIIAAVESTIETLTSGSRSMKASPTPCGTAFVKPDDDKLIYRGITRHSLGGCTIRFSKQSL
jgi:hypothetical protein